MTLVDRNAAGWSVYAIKFAHREKSSREEHFYRAHTEPHETMPISYFVWLVVGGGRVILVDTGFTPEVAARRGDRAYLRTPSDSLAALGIPASDVDTVVITHLHYDHAGFIGAFPDARIIVQERELAYWTGPYAARGDNPHLIELEDIAAAQALLQSGRLEAVDGDVQLAPGVVAHRTGGHTAGLQVVAVDHGDGRNTVIASDASHFFENIGRDRPYSIVDHLPSMFDAFDWITARSAENGVVVPGHDPAVMERFAPVEGHEGLVVRIA
ncbi:N-acyl homoserine lactonase family protein [soil metagenome]